MPSFRLRAPAASLVAADLPDVLDTQGRGGKRAVGTCAGAERSPLGAEAAAGLGGPQTQQPPFLPSGALA